jgi:hypothetical protein
MIEVEVGALADAQPGAVEHLEHGAVAQAERAGGVAVAVDHRADVLDRQRDRQARPLARSPHQLGLVVGDAALLAHELAEAAQGRQLAGQRARLHRAEQVREVAADLPEVQVGGLRLAAATRGDAGEEVLEIAPVRADRVRGEPALALEVDQEPVDRRAHRAQV